MRIILWLMMGALVVTAIGGGIHMYKQSREYTSNLDEERERREVVVREPEVIYQGIDENMLRRIDFEKLWNTNTQATRWIYVPGTAIDDAVVQENVVGQYKYLWRGLDGGRNGSGSYLVPAAPIDEDTGEMAVDDHLIILGHRMNTRNGEWKFSHLPTRWSSVEGAKNYPYIYVYYPDRVERYRVWAHGKDVAGGGYSDNVNPEYLTPYKIGDENYEKMLRYVESRARYTVGRAPTNQDRTLMMSTCNTAHVSGGRTHMTSVLDAEYFYETEELITYE